MGNCSVKQIISIGIAYTEPGWCMQSNFNFVSGAVWSNEAYEWEIWDGNEGSEVWLTSEKGDEGFRCARTYLQWEWLYLFEEEVHLCLYRGGKSLRISTFWSIPISNKVTVNCILLQCVYKSTSNVCNYPNDIIWYRCCSLKWDHQRKY